MTTTATTRQQRTSAQRGVLHGIAGGLAGGVVFGLMMQMMGMLGMVAMLVGSESVAVGWALHLAISALFGAVYGGLVAPRLTGWGSGLLTGAVYGAVLWLLGPLLLMPAKMGMPLFNVDAMALRSLYGHLAYGVVLGAVVVALSRSARA